MCYQEASTKSLHHPLFLISHPPKPSPQGLAAPFLPLGAAFQSKQPPPPTTLQWLTTALCSLCFQQRRVRQSVEMHAGQTYPEVKLQPEARNNSPRTTTELMDREYLEYNDAKTVFCAEACDDLGGEFCSREYQRGVY
ncbi:hypothetical protein GOBAR_AA27339 [Gossypium barbadense]|uniref:Uncharacterized protein n=1 Tax=Gossypium barbadense TaxID=3634 RepID=A0A2P5WQI0_GOSBA|nr:hypothetical protein GOBAR_AA27339 [Gossypium barbadense]